MAKGRMLNKAISSSLRMSQLSSDAARLVYTWLLSHLDINGSFYSEPKLLKGYIVPLLDITADDIRKYLIEFEALGLAVFYTDTKRVYIHYPDFTKKQSRLETNKERTNIPLFTGKNIVEYKSVEKASKTRPEYNIIQSNLIQSNLNIAAKKTAAEPKYNPYKVFIDKYLEKRGQTYISGNTGKDAGIIKNLFTKIKDPVEFEKIIDAFHVTNDPFIVKNGYTIGMLSHGLQKIRLEIKTGKPGKNPVMYDFGRVPDKERFKGGE